MISYKSKILLIPICLFLMVAIAGCSSKDEPREVWDGKLYLCLNVSSTGHAAPGTRAGDDTFFEQPELETEKMHTLRIIIVDDREYISEGKRNPFYNQIVHNKFRTLPSAAISSIDDPELKFNVEFDHDYRIYLIANEQGIPNYDKDYFSSTLRQGNFYMDGSLENIQLDAVKSGAEIVDNDNLELGVAPSLIPMTEIFNVKTKQKPIDPTLENTTQVEDLFVTRAFAKFSFIVKKSNNMADDDFHYTFRYIKVSGLIPLEFLFPKAEYGDPITIGSITGMMVNDFSLPAGNGEPGSHVFDLGRVIDIAEIVTGGNLDYRYTPQLYFTEAKGYEDTDAKFTCSLSLTGEEDDYLEAKALPNLPSLPRNTHVQIIITINAHGFDTEVTVLPYTGVNLNPSFGIDRDDDDDNPSHND